MNTPLSPAAAAICRMTQEIRQLKQTNAELLEALEALTSHPHVHLGDLVYQVRDREGLGWDGPEVTKWSNAVQQASAAIAKAKS